MDKRMMTLLAPEYVHESNGIACGDKLSLYAYIKDGDLYFSYLNNGCSISVSVANYLENNFSGKKELYVREKIDEIINNMDSYFDYPMHRIECALAPIRLLLLFFDNISKCDFSMQNTGALACDACVRMQRINWNTNKDEIIEGKGVSISEEFNPDLDLLQRLGCCVLSDRMQKKFQDIMQNFKEEYLQIVKKYRLAAPLFNNAKKYNLKLAANVKEIVVKQKTSLAVSENEIAVIDTYIKKNNLHVLSVKGSRTGKYYPKGMFRAHMDFDYLAQSVVDASNLIGYLINDRHFKVVIGASVPFSFKTVLDENSNEQLTGHIHLEKILQDEFQVIIDINMGGFPLGRTGIIQFNNQETKFEIEKIICITIAHLFKHEIVYMKDINDLYYLLNDDSVDEEKLFSLLKQYHLDNYFSIVYAYLHKNMNLNRIYKTKINADILASDGEEWPYSSKIHFNIKQKELLDTCICQFGKDIGIKEAKRQIEGGAGVLVSDIYRDICCTLNTRTYLYPLVFFRKPICLKKRIAIKQVTEGLWIRDGIALFSFGMFLLQNDNTQRSRNEVENAVETLMAEFGIETDIFNFDYIMEARKDTWLY